MPDHGAMTPGADGETADGMPLARTMRIIDALRHERYRFQPVKRAWNTVFARERPVAFIAWDLAAPGPRWWDVSFAIWHFVPL